MRSRKNIVITTDTPHFYQWFALNNKHDGLPLLPKNDEYDYEDKLRADCAVLQKTDTPVYLLIDYENLDPSQIRYFENIAATIPNLYIIDYQKFLSRCGDDPAIKNSCNFAREVVENPQGRWKSLHEYAKMQKVDIARVQLLKRPDIAKQLAKEWSMQMGDRKKRSFLTKNKSTGLIYHDFDLKIQGKSMTPITLPDGYSIGCSTTLFRKDEMRKIESLVKEDDSLTQDQKNYVLVKLRDPKTVSDFIRNPDVHPRENLLKILSPNVKLDINCIAVPDANNEAINSSLLLLNPSLDRGSMHPYLSGCIVAQDKDSLPTVLVATKMFDAMEKDHFQVVSDTTWLKSPDYLNKNSVKRFSERYYSPKQRSGERSAKAFGKKPNLLSRLIGRY